MSDEMKTMNSQSKPATNDNLGEPSLAPACGFFAIIIGVVLSIALIFAAWWLNREQSAMASRALQQQLIPWVEQSLLNANDKQSIIERLRELAADMEAKRLDERQLTRLSYRLDSAPVFQWGCIEELQRQARASNELTNEEKDSIDATCDRMLRSVREGKIAMQQISYIVQRVATAERLSGKLTPIENNTAADLREFGRRAETVCDTLEISKEPLDKSPSQVFRLMVDEALNPPPDLTTTK